MGSLEQGCTMTEAKNTLGSRLQHSIECIRTQQANRRLWSEDDDAEKVAGMLLAEAQELVQAIQEAMVTGCVFSVASEVGDVLYLTLRLCDEIGLNPAEVVDMKIKRNAMKYSDAVMSAEYEPAEAVAISKAVWEIMGGDKEFSHAYLDILAKVQDD